MDQPIRSEGASTPQRHNRHVSYNRASLPRRITKGPLEADDPLAGPPTPPPKADLTVSSPSLFSPTPSLASLSLDPPPADFSFLLHPELYHPLSNLNTPTPFRNSPHAPTPDTPLPTLLSHGHFRPAASLAASLLTTPPLPALPTDIFPLLYVRLTCLVLIGALPLAAQEAQTLGDLSASLYRHPETGAHLVPWELRVLAVRLGGVNGEGRREVAGYYELAREARAEVLKGSKEEKGVWKGRLEDLGLRVAGALVQMGDGGAAGRVLRGLKGEGMQDGLWRGRMGLLYLKIGDVKTAREFIAPATTATAIADGPEDSYGALLRPLLSLAEGDSDLAVSQLTAQRDATPFDPLVTLNLAVCLIYAGCLVEARPLLEELVDGGHTFQTLLFNLATVYELCSEKARGLKMELAGKVAGREGRAWGWERGEGDFKL
ncbi:hypothetical protein MMC18_004178 [Xylographa bjoerkii]|nr:hypothetical protein [Xylographa bjoerkii]